MTPISAVSAAASAPQTTNTQGTSTSSAALGTPTESMFLQLLVAQIKNQDPSNPTDGTQFLSQLAQFSELEQVIGIKQDLDAIKTTATTPAATSTAANPA